MGKIRAGSRVTRVREQGIWGERGEGGESGSDRGRGRMNLGGRFLEERKS